ncbi:phytoene desaturase [Verrucomicrobium sp. GAS474]|uniref:phytoene desaturase n=1 Tax=Verrucomicrobium sp. GAS474 TaxID=1882831 RepID=UPI00087CB569|nr:phytoene desaturase [Verrucomicrobium sp. GAS474]SDT85726.1 phytoene desaturase [Verrucomicrobium sp. GAS474]
MKPALVVGSGFGGIAAAIRLQARGYRTTLLEARDQPGGRAYVWRQDGFTFDAGPTILTAPFLIDELFALAGKKTADHLRIVPCHPFYRILFPDGKRFDYTGDGEEIAAEVGRFSPADVAGYRRFAERSEAILKRAFLDLADQPFSTFADMVRVAPDLIRLRSFESVHALVARHIGDPQLRQVFSFHPLLVGGNPYAVSSIYSMIHALEKRWGVHFAIGGTGALVTALIDLFEGMGGEVRLNAPVEEILVRQGIGRKRPVVEGVRLRGGGNLHGERLGARVVVSNADTATTYRKLLPAWARKRWTGARLDGMRYSMGLFVLYFGTNRTYPDLAHHTILLTERYRELLADIFERKILADDFSLYLHAPTRTDPSLAPPGHEAFYVLSPVPNRLGQIDWENKKEAYAEAILKVVEERCCPGLRAHVVTRRISTPADLEREQQVHLGAAFQFEPTLTQSAWFRPHNVSEDVDGLYLVGAGTHPGAGVPGVLSSAKVLDRVIPPPDEVYGV